MRWYEDINGSDEFLQNPFFMASRLHVSNHWIYCLSGSICEHFGIVLAVKEVKAVSVHNSLMVFSQLALPNESYPRSEVVPSAIISPDECGPPSTFEFTRYAIATATHESAAASATTSAQLTSSSRCSCRYSASC